MDYVVVGFGLGALAVLVGLALRDAGPRWRRPRAMQPLTPTALARWVAWGRACRAGGRTLALGGAAACLVTLLALAAGLDDRAGAGLVLATLIAATIGALAWCALYAHRYHPRPVRQPVAAPANSAALAPVRPEHHDVVGGAVAAVATGLAPSSIVATPGTDRGSESVPGGPVAGHRDVAPAETAVDARQPSPVDGMAALAGEGDDANPERSVAAAAGDCSQDGDEPDRRSPTGEPVAAPPVEDDQRRGSDGNLDEREAALVATGSRP